MNAFDRDADGSALIHYGHGEYVVIRPGRYVLCAISGEQVMLEALRYWNVERQEAYAGASEALHGFATPIEAG